MRPSVVVEGARVFLGDCRDVLKTLPDNSVDSIVTDPPYELGFMGKKWDNSGIAYDVTVWLECLRVLKPGGHILAFGGTRTWHRLAVAIEDAGFEIRDNIAWIYGSGFPKSLDVSKAIDKSNGKHEVDLSPFGAYVKELRESKGLSRKQLDDVMGTNTAVSWWEGRASGVQLPSKETYERLKVVLGMDGRFDSLIDWAEAEREVIGQGYRVDNKTSAVPISGATPEGHYDITAPATSEAQQWQGWGTALKPAFEPIVVGRKPIEGTVANNVLAWGVGGLNIDGSRICASDKATFPKRRNVDCGDVFNKETAGWGADSPADSAPGGRWPANVVLDEFTAGLLDEQSGVSKSPKSVTRGSTRNKQVGSFNMAEQVVSGHDDSGGASRFFYQAKASRRDRNEGLEDLGETQRGQKYGLTAGGTSPQQTPHKDEPVKNFHPTVKPTQLMRYLIKLVTPGGGTVLDPFTGSGSTGKAALLDGYGFIGAELTEEYLPIIEGRLRWAVENRDEETLF